MVIAFIPVRGGSKSIPLKNIKPFCGKPLVCWSIEALENCSQVDEIIVATDSDQIEQVVLSKSYQKVSVYRRSAENASDTASTESVMLEFINKEPLSQDIVFMLVQATSPLTETSHFDEALKLYATGKYNSILTCVRSYRFYWNVDGTSKNYDYMNRPRRQNFAGEFMENGAFYINTVGNILKDGNRLSGKIGIYEMPAYTATEIDEEDDWIVLENLMRKHVFLKKGLPLDKNIKLFFSDVDGTLTDGGMYYSEDGNEMKKFNTRDGMGFQLLKEAGVKIGLITSETTRIVENRAQKLKVDYLVQGKRDGGKLEAVKEICSKEGLSLGEIAYVGDDINCFDLLSSVGFAACPVDACLKIRSISGIKILNKKGGDGCVREFIEMFLC